MEFKQLVNVKYNRQICT